MGEEFDFDRYWLDKLSANLATVLEPSGVHSVMRGSETFTCYTPRAEVIEWTMDAMRRMAMHTTEGQRKQIMLDCACHYPQADLESLRDHYSLTRDISAVMEMLQSLFEDFMRDSLGLNDTEIGQVRKMGWGLAGFREGRTVTVTKIPKSGQLVEYLASSNPENRREMYCHCPRVREAVVLGVQLPVMHCYCGAGFYKGLWEEILQQEVDVEVLETVLSGGEVCRFRLHLPIDL